MTPAMLAGIAAAAILALLAVVYLLVYLYVRFAPVEPYLCDEIHTIRTDDLWQISLYRYIAADEGMGRGEPVLICHGMLTNRRNFEIPEDDNLCTFLAGAGYDVWLIEYRGCASGIPPEGHRKDEAAFDDYLLYDMPAAIDYIRKHTGFPKLHIIGHSMGGMLIYAFDQMFGGAALASATALATPIGFDGVELPKMTTLLAIQKRSHRVLLEIIRFGIPFMTLFRLSLKFLPMNWGNVHRAARMRDFCHALDYMPHRVLAELDRIARSKDWRMDAGHLDVKTGMPGLQTPLFAVYGVRDPFIPIEEATRFFEAIEQPDKRLLVLSKENGHSADYSHVDMTLARHGREEVYEPIRQWLGRHTVARGNEALPMAGEREEPAPLAGAYVDAELRYAQPPRVDAPEMPEDLLEPPLEISLPLPDTGVEDEEEEDEAELDWEDIPIAQAPSLPGAEETDVDYDEVLARAQEAMKALEERTDLRRGSAPTPIRVPAQPEEKPTSKKKAAAKKSSRKKAPAKKASSKSTTSPAKKAPSKKKTPAKKGAPRADEKDEGDIPVPKRQIAALEAASELLPEKDAPAKKRSSTGAKSRNRTSSPKKKAARKPAAKKKPKSKE